MAFFISFVVPSVLKPKVGCSVESLTSPPPAPRGSGRNTLTENECSGGAAIEEVNEGW